MPAVRQFLHAFPELRGDTGQGALRRCRPALFGALRGQVNHSFHTDPDRNTVLAQIQHIPQDMPADADIPSPVAQRGQLAERIQQRQSGRLEIKEFRQRFQLTVQQVAAEFRQDLFLQINSDLLPGRFRVREQLVSRNPMPVPQVRGNRCPYVRVPGILNLTLRGDRAAEHIVQHSAFPLRLQVSVGNQPRRPRQVIPDQALFPDQVVHLLQQLTVPGPGEFGIMNIHRLRQRQTRISKHIHLLRPAGGDQEQQRRSQASCPPDHTRELHIHPSVNLYFTSFWAPEQVRPGFRRGPQLFDSPVPPRI